MKRIAPALAGVWLCVCMPTTARAQFWYQTPPPEHGCAVDASDGLPASAGSKGVPVSCSTAGSADIDVVVAYDAALLDQHTASAIETWIDAQVDQMNTVANNGGIGPSASTGMSIQFDVVHKRPVSLNVPEDGGQSGARSKTILDDWVLDPDHPLTELRDAEGADMALFVIPPFTDCVTRHCADVCGVATLPLDFGAGEELELVAGDPSSRVPFVGQAFSVVEYECGDADFTVAHELGHTMGLTHGTANGDAVETAGRLFSYAQGHVGQSASGDTGATLMDCDSSAGGTAVTGACNRVAHLSDPNESTSAPGCSFSLDCLMPLGCLDGDPDCADGGTDNRSATCHRAGDVAGYRTFDGDEAPDVAIVLPAGGAISSGQTVAVQAQVFDDNPGATVEWLDAAGNVVGQGTSTTLTLFTPGDRIGARVTDSALQQFETWVPFDVLWTPDPLEGTEPNITDSHRLTTFDEVDDEDDYTVFPTGGQEVWVRVLGIGERADPILEYRTCLATFPCRQAFTPAPGDGTELRETAAGTTARYEIRVRDAQGSGGLHTEYLIQADTLDPASIAPAQGPWYNPGRAGHGIDFQRSAPDEYVAVWYTYDPDTFRPVWYISHGGVVDGDTWRGVLLSSTWDAVDRTNTLAYAGSAQLDLTGPDTGVWSFTLDCPTQSGCALAGSEPFEVLLGNNGVADGLWFPPADSGWGASIWQHDTVALMVLYAYDAFGQPTWAIAQEDNALGSSLYFDEPFQIPWNSDVCPGCSGGMSSGNVYLGTLLEPAAMSFVLDPADPDMATATVTLPSYASGIPGGWDEPPTPFARLAGD